MGLRTVFAACGALFVGLIGLTFFYSWYSIPSAAMEPSLYDGDMIVVAKWPYGWSRQWPPGGPPTTQARLFFNAPVRGDIVVFKLPRDGRTTYIKRLIGLPSDHVQMKDGTVYINGKALGERVLGPHTVDDRGTPEQADWVEETTPEGRKYIVQDHGRGYAADDTDVYVVPPHCYFMMGDNRDNSADSRFDPGIPANDPKLGGCGWDPKHDAQLADIGVGFVPEDNLIGRVDIILPGAKALAAKRAAPVPTAPSAAPTRP